MATYHCNKIQEPNCSTFRKGVGHLNGVLICYGLEGNRASPIMEKSSKGVIATTLVRAIGCVQCDQSETGSES